MLGASRKLLQHAAIDTGDPTSNFPTEDTSERSKMNLILPLVGGRLHASRHPGLVNIEGFRLLALVTDTIGILRLDTEFVPEIEE